MACGLQPARRSYERLPRSYQESHSDDSLSDDETCSRKRYKRTKKARMQKVSENSSGYVCLVHVMSSKEVNSVLAI